MKSILAISLACAASTLGCLTEWEGPPRVTRIEMRSPEIRRAPPAAAADTSSSSILYLHMTESVRSVCSGSEPFFEYKSAEPRPESQPALDNLSVCMKFGALRGKSITLVGKTDPRGSEQYNDQLGLDRASQVKQYLVQHGVESDRIQLKSGGEVGTSQWPQHYALERRVEIYLSQ
jgi:outer membrane protein OmpA-like peptidoglycan-associated protein